MVEPLVAEVIEQVQQGWEPVREAVDAIAPDGLERPTSSGWTARECIAHIAFWDEAAWGFITLTYFNEPLPEGWAFGSGWLPGDEPWPHFQVHNTREAAWARGQSDEAVLARLEAGHEQLLTILPRLTDELVTNNRAHLDEVVRHYHNHRSELEELVQK